MKKFINLFFSTTIIFLFTFGQVLAHHTSEKNFKLKVYGKKTDIYKKYCTNKKNIEVYYIEKKKNENTTTKRQAINEKDEKGWLLKSYRQIEQKPIEDLFIDGKLYFSLLSSKYFNFKAKPKDKLKDVLDKYCISSLDTERSTETSNQLNKVYKQIAIDNGLDTANKEIGELHKNGIVINIPNLVYRLPDFLIKDIVLQQKDIAASAKTAKDKKWVSDNKPEIVELAEKKLTEQKDIIISVTGKFENVNKDISKLSNDYKRIEKSIKKFFEIGSIQNKSDKNVSEMYEELFDLKEEHFPESPVIEKLQNDIQKTRKKIEGLNSSNDYVNIANRLKSIQQTNSKKRLQGYKGNIDSPNVDTRSIEKKLEQIKQETDEYSKIILNIEELRSDVIELDRNVGSGFNYFNLALYILGFALIVAIGAYVYFQQRKISSLSNATDSAGRKFSELEGQIKSTSDKLQSVASSSRSSSAQSDRQPIATEKPKTPEEIIASKFDELLSDYKDVVDDFSKVVPFKQKWNGLALSRKERQDGTKTILINSSRAFEKSEIWCLNFDNKFFAFPGSTVKSNMAAYMNLDFEKAQRDFKGVFSITSGSSYLAEPSVLRRGGAGFVVERPGKLTFPQ